MCLLAIAYRAHPRYSLIIAANRDEFYARPTQPAHFWNDYPDLLAGRDLVSRGTWLGITRNGRFAALTNFRDPGCFDPHRPSRGNLVSDFLTGEDSSDAYCELLVKQKSKYNGFNLIAGDGRNMNWVSNRARQSIHFTPGIYGLSNHLLDTPWRKVEKTKADLAAMIEGEDISTEAIFQLLLDTTKVGDSALPDTGISQEFERILAPVFIESKDYGTRCSTVILLDHDGSVNFTERSYYPGETTTTVNYTFSVQP